jgi:hypothetical protein
MKSFRETLKTAEEPFGLPKMAEQFDMLGEDVKKYLVHTWPSLAEWTLMDFAIDLILKLPLGKSSIEQKVYLAILKRYLGDLVQYPNSSAILTNKKLSQISSYLVKHGREPIYKGEEIDYEIDIFLYLGFIGMPFLVAIECDGHDFHEKTKQQTSKDKKKIGLWQ